MHGPRAASGVVSASLMASFLPPSPTLIPAAWLAPPWPGCQPAGWQLPAQPSPAVPPLPRAHCPRSSRALPRTPPSSTSARGAARPCLGQRLTVAAGRWEQLERPAALCRDAARIPISALISCTTKLHKGFAGTARAKPASRVGAASRSPGAAPGYPLAAAPSTACATSSAACSSTASASAGAGAGAAGCFLSTAASSAATRRSRLSRASSACGVISRGWARCHVIRVLNGTEGCRRQLPKRAVPCSAVRGESQQPCCTSVERLWYGPRRFRPAGKDTRTRASIKIGSGQTYARQIAHLRRQERAAALYVIMQLVEGRCRREAEAREERRHAHAQQHGRCAAALRAVAFEVCATRCLKAPQLLPDPD
jgi:hypothetical protein